MKTALLPLVLATAQLVWWPGGLLPGGEPPVNGPLTGVVVVLATIGVAAALCLRRSRPVAAVAGVTAALTVAQLVSPADGPAVISLADLIAFYSLAAWRPRGTWVAALGLLACLQAVVCVLEYGVSTEAVVEYGFLLVGYVLAAGAGVARLQWRTGRQAAAAALEQAHTARREAGTGERQRLSAELHDVSAQHLTSVVVSMNAARRLRERRPELLAETLTAAAGTGREALAELRTLLADTGPTAAGADLTDRLAELADAFTRLGQPVTVDASGLGALPGPVAEVTHAIVREALTNTLRYAPGGAVRVHLAVTTPAGSDVGRLTVTVGNEAGTGEGAAGRLGSGRGLAGLRRRVVALGGSLAAAPAAGGGWRVEAVLPTGGLVAPTPERWWNAYRTPLIDVGVVALLLVFSTVGLYLPDEEGWAFRPVAGGVWPVVLLVLHALPLLFRRRAPWLAWAGVFATLGLWPLWLLGQGISDELGVALVFAAGAELVAVYSVGAYARHQWPGLLVVPASAAALGALVVVRVVRDDAAGGEPVGTAITIFISAFAAVVFALPLVLFWLAGFLVRRRRDGVVRREHGAVTAAVAAAESEARAERARLVGGLRAEVLLHTEQVVTAADEGDPDAVLAAARAALAAMRRLLTALDPPPGLAGTASPGDQPRSRPDTSPARAVTA